jgi:hypothetical protein
MAPIQRYHQLFLDERDNITVYRAETDMKERYTNLLSRTIQKFSSIYEVREVILQ